MEEIYLNEVLNKRLYTDREIDITCFIEYWKKQNFILFNKALKFIEQFGNLKIKVKQNNESITYIITSLDNCKINKLAIESYKNFIKKNILCIGFIIGRNENLLLDEQGFFYIASEEYIALIGYNFDEVLEIIINNSFSKLEWNEIEDF